MERRKKILKTCPICKKTFKNWPSWEKKGRGLYCSRKCWSQTIFLKGNKSHNWNGGKTITKGGYILTYCPTHPFALHGNYVLEHRLVMEKHLGRSLLKTEVVHHINGVNDDNRIENLMLFSSSKEHSSFHHPKGNKFSKKTGEVTWRESKV